MSFVPPVNQENSVPGKERLTGSLWVKSIMMVRSGFLLSNKYFTALLRWSFSWFTDCSSDGPLDVFTPTRYCKIYDSAIHLGSGAFLLKMHITFQNRTQSLKAPELL